MRSPSPTTPSTRPVSCLLLLALLTIVTGITGRVDVQYQEQTAVLGDDPDAFPGAADQWTRHGDPENTVLSEHSITLQTASSLWSGATRLFPLVESSDGSRRYLVVRGNFTRVKADPERKSIAFDASTIVAVEFNSADGTRLIVHVPLDITHAKARTQLTDVIDIPDAATQVQFRLLKREAADEVRVSQVSLVQVEQRASYVYWIAGLLAAWAWLLLIVTRQAIRVMTVPQSLFLLSALVGGALLLLLPDLPRYVNQLWQQMVANSNPALSGHSPVEAYGHWVIFFVFGMLGYRVSDRTDVSLVHVVIGLALLGLATELAQLHFSSRSASLDDFLIDLFGIGAAIALSFIWTQWRDKSSL